MTAELFIHIGATKTGSTSIQDFMHDNSEFLAARGLLYPVSGRGRRQHRGHHNLAYEVNETYRNRNKFDPAQGGWSDVLREIDDSPCEKVLISSEAFFIVGPRSASLVAEQLKGRKTTIVAYLRRQDLWFQSQFNHRARFGVIDIESQDDLRSALNSVDYAGFIDPWTKAFGRENVSLVIYDTIASKGGTPGDIMDRLFPSVTGYPEYTARRNSKAGLKQIVAMAEIRRRCRAAISPDYTVSKHVAKKTSDFFRARQGERYDYSLVSHEMAREIMRRAAPANERLFSAMAGGPDLRFPELKPEDFPNYVDLTDTAGILSIEEQAFVNRMVANLIRNSKSPSGAQAADPVDDGEMAALSGALA